MYPSRFRYEAPRSLDEARALLAQHGDEAKILAGGQSLVPLINLGLARPSVLIDINGLHALDYIERQNGSIAVGALTRHATAEASDLLRTACPLLAEALPMIGDPQVRNRGTIGGSLAHADPVAEIPTVAVCLGATMHVEGPRGSRDVDASDFFLTYLTSALESDELLTEVRFPSAPLGAGVAFRELVRRKGDFAIVAAAASVEIGADGVCKVARLALAGVSDMPISCDAPSSILVGRVPTPELLREAATAACTGIGPESDVLASAEYRGAMAPVYARRALESAIARATPQF